ncbi:hypothetical protein V0M98_34765 (plasmid) [Pseudomonas silesiensis]|uniref:hypothetical protein n=1 Tax=Pseudomonas silesiensis TaxID=1853130 RepID=UPI0030D54C34
MFKLYSRVLTRIKLKTDLPNTTVCPNNLLLEAMVFFMMFAFLAWHFWQGITLDDQFNSLDPYSLWISIIGLPIALSLCKLDSLAMMFCGNLITIVILALFDHYHVQIGAFITAHVSLIVFIVFAFGSVVAALKLLRKPGQWLFDRFIETWCKDWENNGFIRRNLAFTNLDKHSVSIHEAGHAIILGLDPLIDDTCELFLAIGPGRGNFGYCRKVVWPHNVHLRSYILMDMVGSLAGVEAEKLIVGECGLGGSADYAKWLDLAERLLLSDPDQVYFSKPVTVPQIEHNRQALNSLRKEHQALARSILEANRDILESLAALLREKHRVAGKELREILSKVKPVAGVPDLSHYTLGIKQKS